MYSGKFSEHGHHQCHSCGGGHVRSKCSVRTIIAVDKECMHPIPSIPERNQQVSVIPFSSGEDSATLKAYENGTVRGVALIGFGELIELDNLPSFSSLNLSTRTDNAFTVPTSGNLKSLAATFTSLTTNTGFSGKVATIHATVFIAPVEGTGIFNATSVTVDLAPSFNGSITAGDIARGFSDRFNFPVVAGDRLLMVFSMTHDGTPVGFLDLVGKLSAGLTIVS